jgi:hypothetical protein
MASDCDTDAMIQPTLGCTYASTPGLKGNLYILGVPISTIVVSPATTLTYLHERSRGTGRRARHRDNFAASGSEGSSSERGHREVGLRVRPTGSIREIAPEV